MCATRTLTGCTPHAGILIPLPRFGVVRETPANLTSRPAGNVAPPSFPMGFCMRPNNKKYCFPPSCGFPPKSFPLEREPTISGDTFGARARATSLRRLCGAANYATCNAPASRRDGALLAYRTSCPRHSLSRRRTCKSGYAAVQVLAGRLQLRISARRG